MHRQSEMEGVAVEPLVRDPGLPIRGGADALPGEQAPVPPFDRVYEEHFDLVWRALRRHGVRPPELDDAIQEVFVVVHDRLPTFEGRSTLRTWIYGIARRVARDHRPDG